VNLSHIPKYEILRCDRNEGMERPEGEAKSLQCERFSSVTELSHRELREIGIKMEWAIHGAQKSQDQGRTIYQIRKEECWCIPRMWIIFIVFIFKLVVKARVS
jgi:hypothetical protein